MATSERVEKEQEEIEQQSEKVKVKMRETTITHQPPIPEVLPTVPEDPEPAFIPEYKLEESNEISEDLGEQMSSQMQEAEESYQAASQKAEEIYRMAIEKKKKEEEDMLAQEKEAAARIAAEQAKQDEEIRVKEAAERKQQQKDAKKHADHLFVVKKEHKAELVNQEGMKHEDRRTFILREETNQAENLKRMSFEDTQGELLRIDTKRELEDRRIMQLEDRFSASMRDEQIGNRESQQMLREDRESAQLRRIREYLDTPDKLSDISRRPRAKLKFSLKLKPHSSEVSKEAPPCPKLTQITPVIIQKTNATYIPTPTPSENGLEDLVFMHKDDAEFISIRSEDIQHISDLSRFSRLTTLVLSMNKIERICNLPPSLRLLDLSQNLIKDIPKLETPNLERLYLDVNQITKINGMDSCRNLTVLSMNNNKLTQISGLNNNPLLIKLILYRNSIGQVDTSALSGNPRLQHLDMGRNELSDISFVQNLSYLRILILFHNKIKTVPSLRMPFLLQLWLDCNEIPSLNFLEYTPILKLLKIDDNNISTVQEFYTPLLQTLNISFNYITEFSHILACFKHNRRITHFSYTDNPIFSCNQDLVYNFNQILSSKLPYLKEINNTVRQGNCKDNIIVSEDHARWSYEQQRIEIFENEFRNRTDVVLSGFDELNQWAINIGSQSVQDFYSVDTMAKSNGIECILYKLKKKVYQESHAARTIQCYWKYKISKLGKLIERYTPHESAITLIQKITRGFLVRKQKRRSPPNHEKIVKIQALWRGYQLRKKLSSALSKAKYDVDLDEFAEVGLDDVNTDMDFDMGLELPEGFNFAQFLQPVPETPPETPLRPKPKPNSATFHRDKKMPSTTKKPVPNVNRENDQKNMEEWGFTKVGVQQAYHERLMRERKRKQKSKPLTAAQRYEQFKKNKQ